MKSSTATATTDTADTARSGGGTAPYVGRFAPSPSGDLHLGSLFTAAASYLDARAHRGRWLLRIEDLDRPREVPGAAAGIMRTLEDFGFEWDGAVAYQSDRVDRYRTALAELRMRGLTFECSCSRRRLLDEDRYPGTCRSRRSSGDAPRASGDAPHSSGDAPHSSGDAPTATRLWVQAGHICFEDRIQGIFRQEVADAIGDFIIRRRDGVIAYVLAVVIDDAAQGINHIVRGADLLDNTPRQIYLQRLLSLDTPAYAHVPVLCEAKGAKLAKARRSVRLDARSPLRQLFDVFILLGLDPNRDLMAASIAEAWTWAAQRWSVDLVPRRLGLHLRA